MKRYDLLPDSEKSEMLAALRDEWICDESEIPSIAIIAEDDEAVAFFTGWLRARGYQLKYQDASQKDQWVKL